MVLILGLLIGGLPPFVFIALGGGICGLLLLLRYPHLSLFILVPVIPFSAFVALTSGGVRIGLMEIILLVALAGWLLQLLTARYRSQPPPLPATRLLWPFLLLLGGVGLSWLTTFSIAGSLVETAKWVEMLLLYLFVTALFSPRHIKWIIIAILLAGVAQAGLGIYQFIFKVGPPGFLLFGGRFLRAYGSFAQPNPYAGYLGLSLPLALSLTIWAGQELLNFSSSGRSHQPQHNKHSSGRSLTAPDVARSADQPQHNKHSSGRSLTAPDVARSADRPQREDRELLNFSKKPKTAAWQLKILTFCLLSLVLTILLLALFASQSRGGWVAFAIAASATVVVGSKKPGLLLAGGLGLGAMVGLIGAVDWNFNQLSSTSNDSAATIITQRLVEATTILSLEDIATIEVTDANFSTLERLAHWQAAREMWRDNPWLGVGFGNYAAIYPAYAVGRWLDPLGHAHNYLLNIGAETGLVGILGYLIFWILVFEVTWDVICKNSGLYRAIAAGCFGVLVHLHIHNLFDNLYVNGMYLHVAIILALVILIYQTKQTGQKSEEPQ